MGALDIQHLNHNMGLEMVCIKDAGMHIHTVPALGFQSFDRLSRDDNMKALGLMSFNCFDMPSTRFAADTSIIFDDSQSLSCLDMLRIPKKSKTQSVALDFKNTVLVEDPLIFKEQEVYMPGSSTDAISREPCNDDTHATSWQLGNIDTHLRCSSDAGLEKLSVEDALAFITYSAEVPSIENFKEILQKCRKISSYVDAKQAHLQLCKNGLEDHKDLGNFLVPMFVECGSMDVARQVFNRLTYRNEHSWTSLIQGYVASEALEQALTLYQMMLHDFIDPSDHTFVTLLKACALAIDVERGKFFHSEVVIKGMEPNAFVGSALVDMYTKCGSLADARHTLNDMSVQDVVPWTSMISGYVEHGFIEEALLCMEDVRKNGLSPDVFTISCCLKACADIGAIDEGRKLHIELIKTGFTRDVFAGIALMDMYVKCGAVFEAKNVFERLRVQDRVSWTTMIMAYVEHEHNQEAFNCLEAMQLEGVSPVAATFVCILKACVSAVENGRFVHCEIVKKGLEGDLLVGNILVDMYAKCGTLTDARGVLAKLLIQDAVPWTSLIAGYLEQGDVEQVLKCFEQVEIEGVPVDQALFVLSLKAFGSLGVLDKGRERHIGAVKMGFEEDIFIGNTLVGMYAKCGALYEASELFSKLSVRNVVSWNALLAGYSDCGPFDEAWKCFGQMQSEGVLMDTVTCACMLKACGSIGAIDKGQEVHNELTKKGYEADFLVASTLVDMYGKCGAVVDAQSMFDLLMVQDLVSWNSLLQAYAVQKLDEEALSCFQQMQLNGVSPDATSWNLMILCYAEQKETDRACLLYARMLEQGLLANNALFVSVLKACGDLASIETVRRIHAQVCNVDGYESIDVTLTTTIIDIYSKWGSMRDAQQVFNALPTTVLAAWSALMAGYARQGNSKLVFHLLLEMAKKGVQPDEGIFLGVLSVCSHAGLLKEGQKLFEMMCECYDIMPHLEHHTCMVDLFGCAGHLDVVVKFVEELPVEPDSVMWRSVMDACSKWGDKVLGRKAFKQAVSLDHRQAGSYISMANLCADVCYMGETEVVEVG